MFKRRTMFVALLLLAGGQAYAGPSTSLNLLTAGGSLTSDNGKLSFSDFKYEALNNGPTSENITVKVLANGLLFGVPVFSFTNVIDYNIQYKVTGLDSMISTVKMQSTGSGTGTGIAGIFKVVEDQNEGGLANLTNVFGSSITMGTSSATFAPQRAIFVRDDIFVIPGNQGTGGISDFSQTFGTEGAATPIPSPTAALAGLALMGVIGLRRRRQDATVSNA